MRKYHIPDISLLAFHPSDLIKSYWKKKNHILTPLLRITNEVQSFSCQKTRDSSFLKGNLAENQYLPSVSNCEYKHQ